MLIYIKQQCIVDSKKRKLAVYFYILGRWGSICSTGWSDASANVTCSMLGYNGGNQIDITNQQIHMQTMDQLTEDLFQMDQSTDRVRVYFWIDQVWCFGDEDSLLDCSLRPLGRTDCSKNQRATAVCLL